jgi:DNA-binding response OmpR family regulator
MASESNPVSNPLPHSNEKRAILHICGREMLRPLRDQILRLSGFEVDSTLNAEEGLQMFWARQYDLVLIDVEGEAAVHAAETMCSEIKSAQPEQLVAFVCNWRVALLTDCPDEILRTEFNPQAFVSGIASILPGADSAT